MRKILTDAYTSRIVRGKSTLKDVTERYFWNELSRERLKAMKAMYALYAKYANVLDKNVHLLKKAKSETKLHILYAVYSTTLRP